MGCSHYSKGARIAAGLQGDNGGKISFPQKSSRGDTEGGGVCRNCHPGQQDTNDVNLFVLDGDVYNFQACIYPKNSPPPHPVLISVTKCKLIQQIVNEGRIPRVQSSVSVLQQFIAFFYYYYFLIKYAGDCLQVQKQMGIFFQEPLI